MMAGGSAVVENVGSLDGWRFPSEPRQVKLTLCLSIKLASESC